MPNISVSVPHKLTRPEARQRVEQLVGDFRNQLGASVGQLNEVWNGDTMDYSFSAMGMAIKGKVFVEDAAVRIDVDLPWPLAALAGNIRRSIEQQGTKMLAHK